MALPPQLDQLSGELQHVNRDAAALCAGLNEAQLGWRAEPGRWSIAENLLHLRTTAEVFMPALDAAIAQAREMNWRSEGPFRLTMMGRLFVWYTEPPPKIRLPAPAPLKPVLQGPAAQALPLFLESQQWILQRLEASNGLDLNRARITSPLAKFVRMDLLTIFHVCGSHGRRHIWQAGNVRKSPDFPG